MAPLDRQVSDSDLVRAAVAGDLQALGTLVERHFGAVYAVALARLRDVDLAQDLAQEVFLRAQLHLDQLGPTGHFAAWTVRIARNLAIDWQRRGLRASRLLPLVPLDTLTHGVPDSQAQGVRETMAIQEEHRALHGAILALPAEQREVMLLHLSDDLSQREIAERLGVNQSTVSRLMRRAMATLRGALEPALRDVAPSLRPPAPAVARSMALVLAVGAMSGVAKASLAASATVGPLASTVETAKAGAAASLGLIGLFKSLPTLLAAGGKLMATGKGIAATVATVAALTAGGVYLTTGGDSRDATRAGGADAPLQSSESAVPEAFQRVAEFVPADTQLLEAVISVDDFLEGVLRLFEEIGGPFEQIELEDISTLQSFGLDTASPMLLLQRQGTNEAILIFTLADVPRYRERLSRESYEPRSHPEGELLVIPDLAGSSAAAVAIRWDVAIQIQSPGAEEALLNLLRSERGSPLMERLHFDDPSGACVAVDGAALLQQHRPMIEDFLAQLSQTSGGPQAATGSPWGRLAAQALEPVAIPLLDAFAAAEPTVLTFSPQSQRLVFGIEYRSAGAISATDAPPRTLTLGTALPEWPILSMVCGEPGERGAAIARRFASIPTRLLVGDNPEAMAAFTELERSVIDFDPADRAEIAMALYHPPRSALWPSRVLIDRRDGGESAQTIVDVLTTVRGYPGRSIEVLDSVSQYGFEVHHLIHRGPALEEVIGPEDRVRAAQSPLQAMFGPIGEVHHWLAAKDDMVILTTEPEPEQMIAILQGQSGVGWPPLPPPAPETSPVPEGDLGFGLRGDALLLWLRDRMISLQGEESPVAQSLTEIAQQLAPFEGICVTADLREDGFDGTVTVPVSLIAPLIQIQARTAQQ